MGIVDLERTLVYGRYPRSLLEAPSSSSDPTSLDWGRGMRLVPTAGSLPASSRPRPRAPLFVQTLDGWKTSLSFILLDTIPLFSGLKG